MLGSEQRDELERTGILMLRGAIPASNVARMRDAVWRTLGKQYGLQCDQPEDWPVGDIGTRRFAGKHHLPKSETFREIGSPSVCSVLDELLSAGEWQPPDRWGSLLVTFPESGGHWDVPHQGWHLDFPAVRGMNGIFGLRLFTCIERLQARGGATLFVAGSHLLFQQLVAGESAPQRLASADARKALMKSHSWVRDLCSKGGAADDRIERLMNRESIIDGIGLRVVEMTGEPGDVLITHPLLLHSGSPNYRTFPRVVLSSTVFRKDVNLHSLYG